MTMEVAMNMRGGEMISKIEVDGQETQEYAKSIAEERASRKDLLDLKQGNSIK